MRACGWNEVRNIEETGGTECSSSFGGIKGKLCKGTDGRIAGDTLLLVTALVQFKFRMRRRIHRRCDWGQGLLPGIHGSAIFLAMLVVTVGQVGEGVLSEGENGPNVFHFILEGHIGQACLGLALQFCKQDFLSSPNILLLPIGITFTSFSFH